MIAFRFIDGGDDPVSLAIKAYQHGDWPTHVDCVMPDGSMLGARSDVIGGIPAGVQIRPANYTSFKRSEIIEIHQGFDQPWLDFLHKQIGKPYDLFDLTADFVAGRDWRNPDSWWCSELAAASGEASFLYHPLADKDLITPSEWRLVCSGWQDG